ncbi:MAG: VWA domain-containing protein [Terriglobales bacterium]
MISKRGKCAWSLAVLVLLASLAFAQESLPDAPQPRNVPQTEQQLPEAPSASRPNPPSFPPASSSPPASPSAAGPSASNPDSVPPGSPPPDKIVTVPPGTAPNLPASPRDELFTLQKNVNFVLVPVTVKDSSGHLVEGLLKRDFAVYEDGVEQNITFFTSDPFPLSAAVVLDLAMPESTWRKVRDTLSALAGAFGQFDEVAIFTYGNTVQKVQDFTGIHAERLSASLRKLKSATARTGDVPVVGGPLYGGPTPTVNGRPLEPNTPHIRTYTVESAVLNDAILAASNELARRDPTRRKVIFVVSTGREVGSANSYSDVLRVLLTRQISVYAVTVGGGGIPGYRDLQKVRIPGQGHGNILPKYASATGGQVFPEFDERAIETAYSRVTEEARNQYTIGYTTRATPSSSYRSIEVVVNRPNLWVRARDGYYPLPPGK